MGNANNFIRWTRHGHAKHSEGFIGDEQVAVITKNKNHTHTNSDIYSVIVKGTKLKKDFRGIQEARAAGESAYRGYAVQPVPAQGAKDP